MHLFKKISGFDQQHTDFLIAQGELVLSTVTPEILELTIYDGQPYDSRFGNLLFSYSTDGISFADGLPVQPGEYTIRHAFERQLCIRRSWRQLFCNNNGFFAAYARTGPRKRHTGFDCRDPVGCGIDGSASYYTHIQKETVWRKDAMKMYKNVLCLLAVGLAAIILSGCGDSPDVTTVNSNETDVTTESAESTVFETNIKDYQGYDFTILSAGNVAYDDFSYEEASSVALDNAMYQRKQKVESDYNINIDAVVQKAYSTGNGPGYQKISQAVLGGDCFYDAALVAGYDVSVLAYNNMLYDLNSVPGLHLEKPWWDQQANSELAIDGLMFFTTGDITNQDNDSVFTLVFNKKLFEDYELENPYSLVKENQWTLESFEKLVKSVGQDLNHDDKMDENDLYGVLVWDDAIMGIINGVGEKCASVQENGEIGSFAVQRKNGQRSGAIF